MTLYLSIAFLGILLWGCGHTEIAHREMQLATPRVPAMAVSTAMITLSNLPQSKWVFEFISFWVLSFSVKGLVSSRTEWEIPRPARDDTKVLGVHKSVSSESSVVYLRSSGVRSCSLWKRISNFEFRTSDFEPRFSDASFVQTSACKLALQCSASAAETRLSSNDSAKLLLYFSASRLTAKCCKVLQSSLL